MDCPICLYSYEEGSIYALRCGHVYHTQCVDRLQHEHPSSSICCPQCRDKTKPLLTPSQLRKLFLNTGPKRESRDASSQTDANPAEVGEEEEQEEEVLRKLLRASQARLRAAEKKAKESEEKAKSYKEKLAVCTRQLEAVTLELREANTKVKDEPPTEEENSVHDAKPVKTGVATRTTRRTTRSSLNPPETSPAKAVQFPLPTGPVASKPETCSENSVHEWNTRGSNGKGRRYRCIHCDLLCKEKWDGNIDRWVVVV